MTRHEADSDSATRRASECGSGRERGHDPGQSEAHRQRHGRRRRRRGSRPHTGRKERVLHTRISEQLSQDIRRFAEDLRVPASNLVRNVLEEVFTMVDSVTDDVGGLFDDLLEEAEAVRDRVRNQMDPSQRRRGGGFASEVDVEDELQRDEAAEARRADSSPRRPPDQAAHEAGSGSSEELRPADLFPDVLGWQPLVLNRDFECGCCRRNLHPGESAFLGIASQGLTEVALCGRCAGRR